MGALVAINRTLDKEISALLRAASLECLVCGEFVLRLPDRSIFCPECGCALEAGVAVTMSSQPAARDVQ